MWRIKTTKDGVWLGRWILHSATQFHPFSTLPRDDQYPLFPGMTNTLYTIAPLIKVSERGKTISGRCGVAVRAAAGMGAGLSKGRSALAGESTFRTGLRSYQGLIKPTSRINQAAVKVFRGRSRHSASLISDSIQRRRS